MRLAALSLCGPPLALSDAGRGSALALCGPPLALSDASTHSGWCHRIDTLISNHLATSNQPSLAKFINVKDKTLPTLNSNIIGQVFSVDMGGHDDWPGHRRVRITEYNALDDMHDFDTTQLDICDTSQSFFAGEDLELNKMLRNGQLTHIPAKDVVLLHQNIVEVQLGYIYTDNVVGRTMRMKLPSDKRTTVLHVCRQLRPLQPRGRTSYHHRQI